MKRVTTTFIQTTLCSLAAATCMACQGTEALLDASGENVDDVAQALYEFNGEQLNGWGQNGWGQNGWGQNGWGQNGWGQNGWGQNGWGQNGWGQNGWGQNGWGQNGWGQNGWGQNGWGQNGWGQNGWGQNGGLHNKTGSLVGIAFDTSEVFGWAAQQPVSSMSISDGQISLTLGNGQTLTGANVVGAFIAGKLQNGIPIVMRINAHEAFTSLTGSTLDRYVIEFRAPGPISDGFVCGKNDGKPIKTIPLTGTWNYGIGVPGGGSKTSDPDLLTFACEGFALYKCVDFGYHPWATHNGISLEDHHQACTRMIRADYCGNGQPYTVNGTIIDLYDNIGIQQDVADWPIEAEWDANGARCLSHQRIQSLTLAPNCQFEKTATECGNPIDWQDTLIVTEAQ